MPKIKAWFIGLLQFLLRRKIVLLPQGRSLSGVTAVKTDDGFWYSGDISDSADLAYGVLFAGAIEPQETELVKKILTFQLAHRESLNFYDIGANSGYYGIMAAYLGAGKIKTFSFEPLAEYCQLIRQSASLNRLDLSVAVFETALGNKEDQSVMYVSGSGSSLHADFLSDPAAPKRTVQISSLDHLIASKNLPGPDFVKIDVEGHELAVLEGGKETFQKHQPVIFVEVAKNLKNIGRDFENKNFEKTFGILSEWGYKIYRQTDEGLLPVGSDFSLPGVHMFLCLPGQKAGEFMNILK